MSLHPYEFCSLFSTCFEIWIWNLVNTFSMWHDTSRLRFIAIWSLGPSLHAAVSYINYFSFIFSWIKINSSNFIHRLPFIYCLTKTSVFRKSHIFEILVIICARFWFSGLSGFSTCFKISFWNLICTSITWHNTWLGYKRQVRHWWVIKSHRKL